MVFDFDAFDVDDTVFNYQIVGGNSGGAFSIDANTGEIFVATGLNFDLVNNYVLNVSATDGAGGVGLADITISLVDILSSSISGTIYEDVNGDGAVLGDGGVSGATVILYRDQGNGIVDSGDILVSTATTNISGGYVFSGLSSGNFYVIVDSHSITPTAGFKAGFSSGDVWAEQTFAGTGGLNWNETTTSYTTRSSPGALFGGLRGNRSDDASIPSRAEHISLVSINGSNQVSSTDFGFSFNVVTNLLAGDGQDDDSLANRTVQGSLRQFIQNSNAIAGRNAMHFVPVVNANRTSILGDWWSLSVSAALPEITDALTSLDGRAFATDGITLRNDNHNWLGSTSVVGVGNDGFAVSGDEYSLAGLDAPELEIRGDGTVDRGLLIKASDVEIRNLAIYGFGNVSQNQGNIVIDGTAGSISGVVVENNVIGSSAEEFVAPVIHALQTRNITVLQADHGLIRHNLIGFASHSGIELRGNNGLSDGADGWVVSQNEIRDNGLNASDGDGISVILGSSGTLISKNLIIGNSGRGIDTWISAGQHQIVNNTISGNGHGNVQLGGLRLFGNQSTVTGNLIANNVGPGIHVVGDSLSNGGISASIGNLISKNSIHRNSGISIDLGSANGSLMQLNQGDGVTENGVGNDVGAGNQGLDHPELTDAYLANDGLHIRGTIARGVGINRVEFYLSAADVGDQWNGHSYGEGQRYLGAKSITDFLQFNASSGEFEALLLRPMTGWPSGLATGEISMIAIDEQQRGTSEFSRNFQVGIPPAEPVVVVPPPVLVGPLPVAPADTNDGTKKDTDKDDAGDVRTDDTSPTAPTGFVGPDSTSTINDVVTNQAEQKILLADTISNDATEIQILVNHVDVVEGTSGNYAFSEIVRPSEILFQLATGSLADRIIAVSTLDATVLVGMFWEELDTANREFLMEQMQIGVPTIAASTASLLTVGYLAWIIRGGVILTTFMSSLPTWKALDILPMIESANQREENDESIEQIVDN